MVFRLAASILTFGAGTSWHHLSGAASSAGWKSWSGFGSAVLAALWAFDGWNNLPMAAGEIRDPDRVIPQSLAWGLIAVLFLYAGVAGGGGRFHSPITTDFAEPSVRRLPPR